ncbi:unnamed protein product [Protopolystoma xenopodis]|uniref:Uncharacterized protein n=1 Tax=Protopolystoma xenopodis TaxID=117903 RepID=A0A448XFT9_9PLAT|nr:unnamed protein product [Protopolystoma xenopodis]
MRIKHADEFGWCCQSADLEADSTPFLEVTVGPSESVPTRLSLVGLAGAGESVRGRVDLKPAESRQSDGGQMEETMCSLEIRRREALHAEDSQTAPDGRLCGQFVVVMVAEPVLDDRSARRRGDLCSGRLGKRRNWGLYRGAKDRTRFVADRQVNP